MWALGRKIKYAHLGNRDTVRRDDRLGVGFTLLE
jgi:hypothetical protein